MEDEYCQAQMIFFNIIKYVLSILIEICIFAINVIEGHL